ncbi:hypothetical protein [Helicobacter cetorum]|uniref:hypothetical protein n=1 Tax=Helicobacter cetorum TaxID=138563 RepID=UPI0013158EB9|nr:hypothetical protein [Helicobacter cetorum]
MKKFKFLAISMLLGLSHLGASEFVYPQVENKELLNKCAKQEILVQVGAIKAMPANLKEPCAKAYNDFIPAFKKNYAKFYANFNEKDFKDFVNSIAISSPIFYGALKASTYMNNDAIKELHKLSSVSFQEFQKQVNQYGGYEGFCSMAAISSLRDEHLASVRKKCVELSKKITAMADGKETLKKYAQDALKVSDVGLKFYSAQYISSKQGEKFIAQLEKIIKEDKAKKEAKQKQQQQDAENERLKKLAE